MNQLLIVEKSTKFGPARRISIPSSSSGCRITSSRRNSAAAPWICGNAPRPRGTPTPWKTRERPPTCSTSHTKPPGYRRGLREHQDRHRGNRRDARRRCRLRLCRSGTARINGKRDRHEFIAQMARRLCRNRRHAEGILRQNYHVRLQGRRLCRGSRLYFQRGRRRILKIEKHPDADNWSSARSTSAGSARIRSSRRRQTSSRVPSFRSRSTIPRSQTIRKSKKASSAACLSRA